MNLTTQECENWCKLSINITKKKYYFNSKNWYLMNYQTRDADIWTKDMTFAPEHSDIIVLVMARESGPGHRVRGACCVH